MAGAEILILRVAQAQDSARARADIEAIFFEAAGPRTFEREQARAEFRHRWLTRYLDHFPDEIFIAATNTGEIIGYLVGCLEDPAGHPLFADITYFPAFAHLTPAFPAHLHINLTSAARGQGIGKHLIAAFAEHARAHGVPGIHAVTGDGVRNNSFYAACGFHRASTTLWNGRAIAFFARACADPVATPPGGGP